MQNETKKLNDIKFLELIRDGKIDKARELQLKSIPDTLVKYIWLDGSISDQQKIDSLASNNIWLSNTSQFNDPYEFKAFYLDRDKLRRSGTSYDRISMYQRFLDTNNDYLVSCLSANDIGYLPMWAYYANNYRGFCIEYKIEKKNALFPVLYEHDRIKVATLVANLFNSTYARINGDLTYEKDRKALLALFSTNLYIKSDTWTHENEFRIIWPGKSDSGMLVPIRLVGLKVQKVVTGINCSEINIKLIDAACKKIGLKKAYRSKPSYTQYGLEIY